MEHHLQPVSAKLLPIYHETRQMHTVDIDSREMTWLSGKNMIGMFDGNNVEYVPIPTKQGNFCIFMYIP